jgi:hypothetical protein
MDMQTKIYFQNMVSVILLQLLSNPYFITILVLMGGLAGYPNFLRSEWIHKILSWQSRSDYGCFLNGGMKKYNTTEIGIPRKQTPAELEKNIEPEETCLVHHTATALGALAVKLEFLHDKCLPYGVEYNIMMEEQVAIKGSL